MQRKLRRVVRPLERTALVPDDFRSFGVLLTDLVGEATSEAHCYVNSDGDGTGYIIFEGMSLSWLDGPSLEGSAARSASDCFLRVSMHSLASVPDICRVKLVARMHMLSTESKVSSGFPGTVVSALWVNFTC